MITKQSDYGSGELWQPVLDEQQCYWMMEECKYKNADVLIYHSFESVIRLRDRQCQKNFKRYYESCTLNKS